MLFIANLIAFIIQLPAATAQAQVCQPGAVANTVAISAHWNTPTANLSREFMTTAKELDGLSKIVAQLKDDSLLTMPIQSLDSFENRLAKAQGDFSTLKKHVLLTVISIDASHRLASTKLIEGYLKLGYTLLSLELLSHPFGATIESVRNSYGLVLTHKQLEEIYPQNLGMSDGVEAHLMKKQNSNTATYQLAWSGENIYRLLVRAAALSKTTRDSKQAYLSTVRCELGRLMIGKLIANESLLGQEHQALPVDLEQKLCLNAPVREFFELALTDSQYSKEQILRKSLSSHWPKTPDSPELIAFFTAFGSKIGRLDLLLDPDSTSNIVRQMIAESDSTSKVTIDTKALSQQLNQYITNQYANTPDLLPLKSLWGDAQLQKTILDVFNDCQFAVQDAFGQPLDAQTIGQMLNKSDALTFVFSLMRGMATSRVEMMAMDETQLKLFLRDFIKNQRRNATIETMLYFFNSYTHLPGYDVNDLMAAVRKEALPLIDQKIDQIWAAGSLDKFVNVLAADILKNRNGAQSMKTALAEYSGQLATAAKNVEDILDPEITAAEKLPYDVAALKRALSPKIATLTGNTKTLVNVLSAEKSFDKSKQIWGELKSLLQDQATAANVNCRPINFFDRLHISEARQAVQRDCSAVNLFAGALGLDEKAPPTQFLNVYYYLRQNVSSSELETITDLYRNELVAPTLNDFRPLMYHVDPKNPKSETFSHYYAHLFGAHLGTLPKIREVLERGTKISREVLTKVVNAKKESDLDWLITKTNVINEVLGQGQLADYLSNLNGFSATPNDPTSGQLFAVESTRAIAERSLNDREGFVFPSLIEYHRHLQTVATQDDFLQQDIRDEFMAAHGTLGTVIMGTMLFKWAYGFTPGWMGRKWVASALERPFDLAGNAISAWGDYVMMLIVGHAYGTYQAKQNFQTELGHVNDLLHADSLRVGTTDNPLPLVEWDVYSRVYHLYDSKNTAANSSLVQDAFWGLFPFSYGTVGRMLGKVTANLRAKSNLQIENMSTSERLAFEETLRRRGTRQLAKLQFYLAALRHPHSLDVAELYMNLQTIRRSPLSKTKTGQAVEIQHAEDAYRKIISELGSQIQNFHDHPNLMESYAKSLFGEGGDTRQLDEIYREWVRIFVNGEEP